jgi:hypothetical protein
LPPIPFAGTDITGNPIQFIDLDGDGYVDMIYSYKNKDGKVITKIYFNVSDGPNPAKRKWLEYKDSIDTLAKFIPPPGVFPLSAYNIGDMGVRFTKFDRNRLGILIGFRPGEPDDCETQETGDPDNPSTVTTCTPVVGTSRRAAFAFDGASPATGSKICGSSSSNTGS